MAKRIKRISKQLLSRRLLGLILDDFSLFGSVPFYWLYSLSILFIGNTDLFQKLAYSYLISIIVVLVIKGVHHKDRPQKEEFNIFMEKIVASSFPSTHSLSITLIAVLTYLEYPEIWIAAIFGFIALMVYTQRYARKKHFAMDIIGGILTALVIAVFVLKIL